MAPHELAARVTAYMQRQIAWFEQRLLDLEHFGAAFESGNFQGLEESHLRSGVELETFSREHHALLREWRADENISMRDRKQVRQLARRAESLNQQVLARYELTARRVDAAIEADRVGLSGLRRGKDWLEKYRPGGGEPAPGLFDTKA